MKKRERKSGEKEGARERERESQVEMFLIAP